MRLRETDASAKRLDFLFSKATEVDKDPEVLAHWARYLCILTSGLLDVALPEICSEFTRARSHVYVTNFVRDSTDRSSNFKMERLLTIIGRFSPALAHDVDSVLTDEEKAAINSVVSLRNELAHGRNSGISYLMMVNYYKCVRQALRKIEGCFDSV